MIRSITFLVLLLVVCTYPASAQADDLLAKYDFGLHFWGIAYQPPGDLITPALVGNRNGRFGDTLRLVPQPIVTDVTQVFTRLDPGFDTFTSQFTNGISDLDHFGVFIWSGAYDGTTSEPGGGTMIDTPESNLTYFVPHTGADLVGYSIDSVRFSFHSSRLPPGFFPIQLDTVTSFELYGSVPSPSALPLAFLLAARRPRRTAARA